MEHGDRLADVAEIWNKATGNNEPRIAAIQAAFPQVAPRTIQRWIHEARQHGLLPEARRGNWGANTSKLQAVAQSLGVSYVDLVIALREHAGGYLRISASEERHARESRRST